jgi:Holliday junction resolvasome RuvABC DNA-binding subunit
MANFALFITSLVIGYLVVRYRVRVIVVVRTPASKASISAVSGTKPARAQRDFQISQRETELASALVNLGCKRKEARAAAERACLTGAGDFDTLLRIAIREAAA